MVRDGWLQGPATDMGGGLSLSLIAPVTRSGVVTLGAWPGLGSDHSSDRRRLNPCQDSRSRWSARSEARTYDLDRDLAGLHNASAGGMGRLRDLARHRWRCGELPRRSAAGVSARRRRRGPLGPKSGRRRPAWHGFPLAASQLRAGTAPPCRQRLPRAALSRCGD
jgi:hypothetical protein